MEAMLPTQGINFDGRMGKTRSGETYLPREHINQLYDGISLFSMCPAFFSVVGPFRAELTEIDMEW